MIKTNNEMIADKRAYVAPAARQFAVNTNGLICESPNYGDTPDIDGENNLGEI